MPSRRLAPLWSYAVAVLITAAAFGVRLSLLPTDRPLLIFFVLPSALTAYVGGLGPGLFAAALSAAGSLYFLIPPVRTFQLASRLDSIQWLVFCAVAFVVTWITDSAYRSGRRAREAERQNEDLVARRREEQARVDDAARFQAFARDAPLGIVFGKRDGTIGYANDEYLRILGYSRHDFDRGGVRWDEITPPEWLAADRDAIERLGRERVVRYEKEYVRRDGARVPVLIGLTEIADSLAAFVLDLTAERASQRALHESQRRLLEADRRKDEFLGVLSHELRNPLAPIRNALFILDRAAPGSEQGARAKAIISRQVEHLTRLVDDLLDVTRITRGKIQLRREHLDLREIARRVVEDHRPVFAAREIALELDEPPDPVAVDGDPTRLAQVLGNLLGNAAKFTDHGGRVHVGVAREGEAAVVTVRDSGVGIAPDVIGRVFEPFTQADESLHRTQGGLGLGLALVKGLAELHGGTAAVSSRGEGLGAEFSVRLPAADHEAAAHPAAAPVPAALATGKRILVVEDNVDAADTLREVLQLSGHTVEVAYDGPSGIDKARTFEPHVVLCDIGLPDVDGYGVARAIRAHDPSGATVLVALTGYARPEDQKRAADAGFHQHLSKPVDLDELNAVLRRAGAPRVARA